jgi:hypothetical protein
MLWYTEVTWECVGLSCYYLAGLGRGAVEKAQAETGCAAVGAHLLAIETPQENAVLNDLLAQPSKRGVVGSEGGGGAYKPP